MLSGSDEGDSSSNESSSTTSERRSCESCRSEWRRTLFRSGTSLTGLKGASGMVVYNLMVYRETGLPAMNNTVHA